MKKQIFHLKNLAEAALRKRKQEVNMHTYYRRVAQVFSGSYMNMSEEDYDNLIKTVESESTRVVAYLSDSKKKLQAAQSAA